jgi:uncharacterized delta-60 repeat protein
VGKPAVTVAALAVLASALLASLAMALAAGDFDPSFSGDGVFVEPLGDGQRPGGDVSALALQPDGKIVVAGGGSSSNIVIARLNPDGTLDPSFGTGGKVLTTLGTGSGDSLFPRAVAIQADGRILVGGLLFPNGGTQRPFVARLNSDGSMDGSYASGGLFAAQLGADPNPYSGLQAIVLQPDGKLLLAGGAKDATGQGAVLVARLNAQGNLDGSFGNGGKATPQLGEGTSPNSGANALALQPDGKIVIAGSGTDTNNPAQPDAAVVARLDSEGKNLDPSFGSGGKVLSRLGQSAPVITTPHAVALQPDGKPVVAGEAIDGSGHQHVLVSRLNADGQGLDPGFATGGTLFTTLGDGPNADSSLSALVLQPDGKIVGAGYGEGTSFVGALIARLKSDGTLDGAFANGGKILAPLGQVSGLRRDRGGSERKARRRRERAQQRERQHRHASAGRAGDRRSAAGRVVHRIAEPGRRGTAGRVRRQRLD